MKLKYDKLLSNFAFNCNLRHYTKAAPAPPPGMLRTTMLVVQHEGYLGLYKGLSASLLRQATFIGTKFGAYDVLKNAVPKDADGTMPFWKMTLCGLGAGAMGAAVGNPADLAMARPHTHPLLSPT